MLLPLRRLLMVQCCPPRCARRPTLVQCSWACPLLAAPVPRCAPYRTPVAAAPRPTLPTCAGTLLLGLSHVLLTALLAWLVVRRRPFYVRHRELLATLGTLHYSVLDMHAGGRAGGCGAAAAWFAARLGQRLGLAWLAQQPA